MIIIIIIIVAIVVVVFLAFIVLCVFAVAVVIPVGKCYEIIPNIDPMCPGIIIFRILFRNRRTYCNFFPQDPCVLVHSVFLLDSTTRGSRRKQRLSIVLLMRIPQNLTQHIFSMRPRGWSNKLIIRIIINKNN